MTIGQYRPYCLLLRLAIDCLQTNLYKVRIECVQRPYSLTRILPCVPDSNIQFIRDLGARGDQVLQERFLVVGKEDCQFLCGRNHPVAVIVQQEHSLCVFWTNQLIRRKGKMYV